MILEQDHLRESTHNYQNGIISFSGPRQPKDKVQAKITQGVCGIISGVHKPMICFLALPRWQVQHWDTILATLLFK